MFEQWHRREDLLFFIVFGYFIYCLSVGKLYIREPMPNIKDVLYVRFRVTDLQAQKQFLEDFGFQTKLEGDRLFDRVFRAPISCVRL